MACVPAIISALGITVNKNESFIYDIEASCCPIIFDISDLPSGVSFDTFSGILSGSIDTSGTYNLSISAYTVEEHITQTFVINVVN